MAGELSGIIVVVDYVPEVEVDISSTIIVADYIPPSQPVSNTGIIIVTDYTVPPKVEVSSTFVVGDYIPADGLINTSGTILVVDYIPTQPPPDPEPGEYPIPLTYHKSGITILREDVANSWYGGLYGTEEGNTLGTGHPLVAGHVHDGLHYDGHAQKINLGDHTTGQLDGSMIQNFSIPLVKLEGNFSGGSSGNESLAETLLIGNITGGTDIVLTAGDAIRGVDAANGTDLPLLTGKTTGGGKFGSIYSNQGNSRGSGAIDLQSITDFADQVASPDFSVILGGYKNKILPSSNPSIGTNEKSVIIGGESNVIGGVLSKNSVIIGGTGNNIGNGGIANNGTLGTQFSSIIGGQDNTITNYSQHCSILGGKGNLIGSNPNYNNYFVIMTGEYNQSIGSSTYGDVNHSFISGSNNKNYGGSYSMLIGDSCKVYGDYNLSGGKSVVNSSKFTVMFGKNHTNLSGNPNNTAYSGLFGVNGHLYNRGQIAFSSHNNISLGNGDAQRSNYSLQAITSDASPTILTTTGAAPSVDADRLRILPGHLYYLKIYLVARQYDGIAGTVGDVATWEITTAIKRDLSNNTTLLGSNGSGATFYNDAGAASWIVAVTADDANEALQITVTGELNKNIAWHASIFSSEAGKQS